MALSQAEIKEIFKLKSEGKSYREIERLTGVSKTKVGKILKSENTVPPPFDSEKKDSCPLLSPNCSFNCKKECSFEDINKRASIGLYNFMQNWKELMEKRADAYLFYSKKSRRK